MEKQEVQRDQWGSRLGFILAAVGSAIGLGNIWRFPYMAYENGGGAFLVPYFFAVLTAGIPLLVLEMGLGHKMRGSAPLAFRKIKKKYETLGWWAVLVTAVVTVYYSVIVAWAVNYMFFAVRQTWGSDPNAFFYGDYLGVTEFWKLGSIKVNVLVGLVAVWGLTYTILYNGIKEGIEKASKIFMPLLIILLGIITVRGVTLPGAVEGLNHFLEPDFSVLKNPSVWVSAYGQVFFTLSLGFGIMIAYSSYLPKKSDVVNNAFITAFANCGFSFLAGFAVFGILGYMSQTQGVPIDEVANGGIGLAFIVFPEAINLLPGMNGLFGLLFFMSLVVAGMSSIISLVEAFASSIMDKFQMTRKEAVTKVCLGGFALTIIFATGMGILVLDLVDHFLNNYGLAVVGLAECVILGYLWKLSILKDHVNAVSDFAVGNWWDVSIKYITTIILAIMLVFKFKAEITVPYGGYPTSALMTLGWGLVIALFVLANVMKNISWNEEVLLDASAVKEEL